MHSIELDLSISRILTDMLLAHRVSGSVPMLAQQAGIYVSKLLSVMASPRRIRDLGCTRYKLAVKGHGIVGIVGNIAYRSTQVLFHRSLPLRLHGYPTVLIPSHIPYTLCLPCSPPHAPGESRPAASSDSGPSPTNSPPGAPFLLRRPFRFPPCCLVSKAFRPYYLAVVQHHCASMIALPSPFLPPPPVSCLLAPSHTLSPCVSPGITPPPSLLTPAP